jgi:hypothetical protein
MSDSSKKIADQFEAAKGQASIQDAVNLEEKKVLDEGFRRMQAELQESFLAHCEELNQEPKIGNILNCGIEGDNLKVTRTDTGDVLSVSFDTVLHKATFKCDRPIKFRDYIEVKPTTNKSAWWFTNKAGGLGAQGPPFMALKALKSLLGIPN